MKFAIRDDDTNYFTKSEELENIYTNIWDKCPVSLSVVPFHRGTKTGAIPKSCWESSKIFPIGENKVLVKFLKIKIKEGKVSIMLHGHNHGNTPEGYEFEAGENLYEKVKEGKEYLDKIFGVEINTFVPPHNTLSKDGFSAVVDNNLNIVNIPSFHIRKRPVSFSNVLPFLKYRYWHWRYKHSYFYVLRFSNHSELSCQGLIPGVKLESLIDDFNFCYQHNGNFCLTTHYWELFKNERMRKIFEEFWKYIGEFDKIKFISINEIFKSI